MYSTDPISDMLTRIRNAININRSNIEVPHSKVKETLAKQLQDSNFIDGFSVSGDGISKKIDIVINEPGTNSRINEIVRISKPGRRMYAKSKDIPKYKSGRGVVIISTSQGVMTGSEATKKQLGGELICKVY